MDSMINNYNSKQSSCYFLDIRNSTNIIRTISLDADQKNINNTEARMKAHSEFMLDIHKFLFQKLTELNITDHYFSNTGDGHTCLLWNKTHAWTILHIACAMSTYLETRVEEYRTAHLDGWCKEYQKEMSIGFGIGMHTGGSIVTYEKMSNSNFAYGVVLNSAARTEAFTKNFPTIPILFTGNLKHYLKKQFSSLSSPKKATWEEYEPLISPVTKCTIDIKDSKPTGHILFSIDKKNRAFFMTS